MPETGIEPVRGLARRILSPVRLPVPPLGHIKNLATTYSPGPTPAKYHRPL